VIARLGDQIRDICRELMANAAEKRDVEFVHDVTSGLPSRVIGELMGLPREDWPTINALAERNTSSQDPDIESAGAGDASAEMAMYAIGFAMRRRQEEPREDLTTLILESDFGGTHMTDIDFGSFFVQLVTAGNDTTKTMLSSGLLALLQHPDQMAQLRDDPALVGSAVEEILRFANPLHYFRRTATADTELRDQAIAAGDKVAMYYTAANRDPDVFADRHRFDIRRNPNPHLSFGIAEHFCLGVHLARLEGRVFFEELLRAFPTIELTGEPVRTRSNLNNALKSLPVRLTAA
jgi:cytochrome P450